MQIRSSAPAPTLTLPVARRVPLIASLALALGVLLSPRAGAQGLVQVTLTDALEATSATRLQITVGALVGGEARQVDMDVFMAAGTRASEIAALIATRLTRAEFDILAPPSPPLKEGSRGTFFLEDALFVRVRLGGDFVTAVTTCAGPPASLRLGAPEKRGGDALLTATAEVRQPSTKRSETLQWTQPLGVDDHPAQVSATLQDTAREAGLLSERPMGDTWKPVRTKEGGLVTGMTFSVSGTADWRLEVELPLVPESERSAR